MLLLSGQGYRLLCFDLKKMQFVSAEGMKYPSDGTVWAGSNGYGLIKIEDGEKLTS